MQVENVNSVQYPAWWAGATTVTIRLADNSNVTRDREDVELLPQGPSVTPDGIQYSWVFVREIDKAS